MNLSEILPIFCDDIPNIKEHGKLYISKKYEIAIHLCACGCGRQSVTPLGNGEWNLTEANGKVTLRPSIGNFNGEKPYHAHYFITNNQIQFC